MHCPILVVLCFGSNVHLVWYHLSRNGWGIFCDEKTFTLWGLSWLRSSSNICPVDVASCACEVPKVCVFLIGSKTLLEDFPFFSTLSPVAILLDGDLSVERTSLNPLPALTLLSADT